MASLTKVGVNIVLLGNHMYSLIFVPNSGAAPFILGDSRNIIRSQISGRPRTLQNQLHHDKYPELGLYFGYDECDILVFLEVADPSAAYYGKLPLLSGTSKKKLIATLATTGRYLDLFGTLVFRDIGISLSGFNGGARSAAIFSSGYYDSVISEFGEDSLTKTV